MLKAMEIAPLTAREKRRAVPPAQSAEAAVKDEEGEREDDVKELHELEVCSRSELMVARELIEERLGKGCPSTSQSLSTQSSLQTRKAGGHQPSGTHHSW